MSTACRWRSGCARGWWPGHADRQGSVEVVGTRDCTLQRRFQKLVEEAPAPFLDEGTQQAIEGCAADIARAAGYVNAGTVEFLLSPTGQLSFLEVNTRLQVEHSVTEASSDLDIVRAQLSIAAGLSLEIALGQAGDGAARHAVEFRINAEDPANGFAPSTGTITCLRVPAGPGVRLDSGVELGTVVGGEFDSLLAKLVVSGRDRTEALERARRALDEFEIDGVRTTLGFCRDVVRDRAFAGPDGLTVHTRWIEDDYVASAAAEPGGSDPIPAVRIGGRWLPIDLPGLLGATDGRLAEVRQQTRERVQRADADADAVVSSPMQGTVVQLHVADGDHVSAGDVVAVVEAMKMENQLRAPHDGQVTELGVAVGDTVAQGEAICRIDTTD